MNGTAFFFSMVLASTSTELSGRIVDQQGAPIEGAIVVVSTAKPRVGPSITCPSCYPDCKKRVLSDAGGNFVIEGLSSKLLFSLAAGGSGYQGMVSEHFDPAEQEAIELKLKPIPASSDVRIASGRVIDRGGNPIAGAEVRSRTIFRSDGRVGGSDPSVTPLTLTDSDGFFQVTTGENIDKLTLRIQAAGYAPQDITWASGNEKTLEIALGPGASIRGRLMADGSPLGAVEVGIVQENRVMGNIVTPQEVSTDDDGYFQFDQLPPALDYTLYTHTGQGAKGALPVSLIGAPEHGQRADLGDIATQSPHRLTITVRTEDGSKIPDKSYVYVGRDRAWRGSSLPLDRQPITRVELSDLASEMFEIRVRVPGYEVARSRPALNVDRNRRYPIHVKGDTDVVFVVRKVGAEKPGDAET